MVPVFSGVRPSPGAALFGSGPPPRWFGAVSGWVGPPPSLRFGAVQDRVAPQLGAKADRPAFHRLGAGRHNARKDEFHEGPFSLALALNRARNSTKAAVP